MHNFTYKEMVIALVMLLALGTGSLFLKGFVLDRNVEQGDTLTQQPTLSSLAALSSADLGTLLDILGSKFNKLQDRLIPKQRNGLSFEIARPLPKPVSFQPFQLARLGLSNVERDRPVQGAGEVKDSGVLLRIAFDVDLLGDEGESPIDTDSADLTIFDGGLRGNGVTLDKGSTLIYASTGGNIRSDRGSLELWFRGSNWKNDGYIAHRLFDLRFECPLGTDCDAAFLILDVDTWNKLVGFTAADGISSVGSVYAYEHDYGNTLESQWNHVVATWDESSGTEFYLNGELVAHKAGTFSLAEPKADIVLSSPRETTIGIGSVEPNAVIDELVIYDRVLTASEVQEQYEELKNPNFVFNTSDTSLGFKIEKGRTVGSLLEHANEFISGQDGGQTLAFNELVLWMFGDTGINDGGPGMNNTFAQTNDTRAEDGISLEYKTDESGRPVPILEPQGRESAIWPGQMVTINDTVYTFYSTIRSDPELWFVGLEEGWAKTTEPFEDVQSAEFVRTGVSWPNDSETYVPTGPGFPLLQRDGYVYFGGELDDGTGFTMGRVTEAQIEDKGAYEYWDGSGWNSDRGKRVNLLTGTYTDAQGSTFFVEWNEWLGKWLMTYTALGPNADTPAIVARVADDPVPPWDETWSEAKVLVDCPDEFISCYSGLWHPEYNEGNGETIYLTVANWQRYQIYILELELEKTDSE